MLSTYDDDVLRLALQMSEYKQRIGRRIAEARKAKGWTQVQLARVLPESVDGATISRWEKGKVMPAKHMDALAEALGVDVSYFMAPEAEPGTPDLMGALTAPPSEEATPARRGARFRAAQAYVDLDADEMAELYEVHERTIARCRTGERELKAHELAILVERGVPAWFITHGWNPPVAIREQIALDRITALEHQVAALTESVAATRAGSALGKAARVGKDELASHRKAPRRKRGTAPRPGSPGASDQR